MSDGYAFESESPTPIEKVHNPAKDVNRIMQLEIITD
jgi:hypothetical protein